MIIIKREYTKKSYIIRSKYLTEYILQKEDNGPYIGPKQKPN